MSPGMTACQDGGDPTGPEKGAQMRRTYAAANALMLLAVLIQFYFAAVGAFAKPQHDNSFVLHDTTGMMVIPTIALVATVAAALARVSGRLIGLTVLPVVLVGLQSLIIVVGGGDNDSTTSAGLAVLGLHALNGVVILWLAAYVLRRSVELVKAPR